MFESVSVKAHKTDAPSNGHLIVFYKVQLGLDCEKIRLDFDPEEVEALSWVSKNNIRKIFNNLPGELDCI